MGSVFHQNDYYVPIRLWLYEALMTCRTTSDFVRLVASQPTRGKGYSAVVADRSGQVRSLEIACPLFQVRPPSLPTGHIHCVNCYQLPMLAQADRRNEQGKAHALARWRLLNEYLSQDKALGLTDMEQILRHHGSPCICRHGSQTDKDDYGATEFSYICQPGTGTVYFCYGPPCSNEYEQVQL